MRLLKGGWAVKRLQGPALPWAGLLLVLLTAFVIGVELLVKGLPANHSLYGDAKAHWTINEYADLECLPYKVYTPRLERWVDSRPGMNLVQRHLPLQMHGEVARHQTHLVEYAGTQGGAKAFWSAIDAIFTQSVGNGGGLAGGTLDFPELDQSRLEKCAKDKDLVDQLIKTDIDTAQSKDITAIPTLVIRNNQTGRSVKLEGVTDEVTLLSAIDWLVKDRQCRAKRLLAKKSARIPTSLFWASRVPCISPGRTSTSSPFTVFTILLRPELVRLSLNSIAGRASM